MRAPAPPAEQAAALALSHGRRASQHLIDEIVIALKAGDQARATDRAAVLQALTALVDGPGEALS